MLRPTVLICGASGWEHHHDALAAAGYRVTEASTVASAAARLHARRPDLVVLDATGIASDVHEVCRQVRALGQVPVVVVAAPTPHGRLDDVVQLMAFAAGADDVVPADISSRLLLARLGAVLRRTVPGTAPVSPCRVGPFELDPETRVATMAGVCLDLTRIEFDLLAVLLEQPARVVPREELVSRVWGAWLGDDHVVEVHLSRLRAKVVHSGGPRIGVPVRGIGYRLGIGSPVAV